jgi:hypothetical protein
LSGASRSAVESIGVIWSGRGGEGRGGIFQGCNANAVRW